MKSTLKTSLLGLLLMGATVAHSEDVQALTDLQKVKNALNGIITDGQRVHDATILYTSSGLDNNNPSWLCKHIQEKLKATPETAHFTVSPQWRASLAITVVNYVAGTADKVLGVYNNGNCVCGIKFSITNNICTATYLKPEDVIAAFQKGNVIKTSVKGMATIPHEYRFWYYIAGTALATEAIHYAVPAVKTLVTTYLK